MADPDARDPDELLLPAAVVGRLMKQALPPGAVISKECRAGERRWGFSSRWEEA